MKKNNEFLVQIICTSYNHASYIKDAMAGFVIQNTAFPFVAVIIDDASTDNTSDAIRQYIYNNFAWNDSIVSRIEKKDFGQFIFAQHKTNKNCFFAAFLLKENHHQSNKDKSNYYQEWLESKYTALCEGDDYWTDPFKIQKQVDYMDSHPNCTLLVHSANWLIDNHITPGGCQDPFPKDYSVEELIKCGGLYFATASFFFKSELGNDWPEWRRKAAVGDFPLQILSGLRGNVHYLPDNMCVYRYLHEGSWSFDQQHKDSTIVFQKNKIEWMTLLDEATGHLYQKTIYNHLFQYYNSLFNFQEIGFWDYAKAALKCEHKRYGRLIKDFLRFYLTPVYCIFNHFRKK